MSTTTLLVIGGGIGGLSAIAGVRRVEQKLKTNAAAKVILVDPKDFCEIAWAAYRSPFSESVAEGSLLPLQPFCEKNDVTHIRTTVIKLDSNNKATLANGETVSFDVCLIAVGATSKWPAMGRGIPTTNDGTRQARLEEMKAEGNKLLSAKSVLIAGGGLIGAELAGDLAGYSKEKAEKDGSTPPKVTLVHSKSHLCPELSESGATKVQRKLEGLGVTVILNDHAVKSDGKMVLKSTGVELEAEQVVLTIGIQPVNTFLLDGSISGDALDERGWIVADEYCRVQGSDGKLFAFGDCCTHMPNSGNHLFSNADNIGNNLVVSLGSCNKSGNEKAADDDSKLTKVTPNPSIVCCTVGPKDGIFSTSYFSTDWIVPGVKNSNMFFPNFKKAIEY